MTCQMGQKIPYLEDILNDELFTRYRQFLVFNGKDPFGRHPPDYVFNEKTGLSSARAGRQRGVLSSKHALEPFILESADPWATCTNA